MQITGRVSTSFLRTVSIIYFYVFTEWMFFVSKSSYLNRFGFFEQVEVFLVSSLYIVSMGVSAYAVLALIQSALPVKTRRKLPISLNAIVAAVFATTLTVLLIDNFTYTILKIGIVRTQSYQVAIYGLAVLGLFYWCLREFTLGDKVELNVWAKKTIVYGSSGILLASLLVSGWRLCTSDTFSIVTSGDRNRTYPNILLFASDGIEADKLSIYGYHRKTTPNLSRLTDQGLIAKAALSNAGRTTGSTTSMLTGKLPTTTKVLFPPHVLVGNDSYEHLPGMLRSLGYRTFQETIRYYGDSSDLNMRNSFQVANGRFIEEPKGQFTQQLLYTFATSMLLVERLKQRIEDRFFHLTGITKMDAPFDAVKNRPVVKVYGFTDEARVERAIEFMNESDAPFFSHIHLMESHCCSYDPLKRIFSRKHETFNEENSVDFLDDAILESDRQFGKIVDELKKSGKFENTIIVYSSDHSEGWGTDRRLPLVFLFPDGRHKGQIEQTVQLADVAPTLLEYLKLDAPKWMEGVSLLNEEKLNPMRPIYSVNGIRRKKLKTRFDDLTKLVGEGPPYYGMKRMGLTVCQRRYVLNLINGTGEMYDIPNHPRPCDESKLPDLKTGLAMISKHLNERGFRVH